MHTIPNRIRRTNTEILEVTEQILDLVWYTRSLISKQRRARGAAPAIAPDDEERIREAMTKIEDTYGAENILPTDTWQRGFLNGKLSALRWIMGEDWDSLDT